MVHNSHIFKCFNFRCLFVLYCLKFTEKAKKINIMRELEHLYLVKKKNKVESNLINLYPFFPAYTDNGKVLLVRTNTYTVV